MPLILYGADDDTNLQIIDLFVNAATMVTMESRSGNVRFIPVYNRLKSKEDVEKYLKKYEDDDRVLIYIAHVVNTPLLENYLKKSTSQKIIMVPFNTKAYICDSRFVHVYIYIILLFI